MFNTIRQYLECAANVMVAGWTVRIVKEILAQQKKIKFEKKSKLSAGNQCNYGF
jgi:hypothetical protein